MGVATRHNRTLGAAVTKPIVLIAEELSPATVEALGPEFEVRYCDGSDRGQLLPAIADVDAILVRSATKVDAEALAAARNLKVIARAGVGLDNVDVKAATQAGVMVVNAPTSNVVSAAELAVALILACARNIVPANEALARGEWKRSKFSGVEMADKVVGIVGFGRIGTLVAQRISSFGVRIIAYDPFVQPARAAQLGVKIVELDELLAESDFITVHLPKTSETLGLIGDDALRKVKPTVRIINAARGGIVDEAALYEAIVEGRVAGAGVDVYSKEPCTDSPLFALENVVATPHLGASTDEAQEKAGLSVARSVRLALEGELVPDAVNVQGGVLAECVKPLLPLAEQLGSIACALSAGAIERVDVEVLGEVATEDVRVLELAALKGILGQLVDDPVSYVNAPVMAKERGIHVCLITDAESPDHRLEVRVRTTLADGNSSLVGGTVVGPHNELKLVEVDGVDLDVAISEHMFFLGHEDRPGVVGQLGHILGDEAINIAGMQVGRTGAGGQALTVLTVDSAIPSGIADEITREIGADFGRAVDLD